MEPSSVIVLERLTKRYRRDRGIEDLSLRVQRGEIFGFLGPNGAGKTTTIRILVDLIRPQAGSAEVLGFDVRRRGVDVRRRVGYLPGDLVLNERMTGAQIIDFFSSFRGGVDRAWVDQLAERLSCDLTRRVRALSHGNRQKIGVIQALMHRPELLILDEPTQGLDPLMQHEVLRLLMELRDAGTTIFLSSHVLPEVEQVCDRVGMIREGRLITVEHVDVLKQRAAHRLEIRFAARVPPEAFVGLSGVRDVQVDGEFLRCLVTGTPDAVVKAAASFTVIDIISHEPSLEDIFLASYAPEVGRAS